MLDVGQNKIEDKNARADRIYKQVVSAERREVEKKTARLRELRLAQEAKQAIESEQAPKKVARSRASTSSTKAR